MIGSHWPSQAIPGTYACGRLAPGPFPLKAWRPKRTVGLPVHIQLINVGERQKMQERPNWTLSGPQAGVPQFLVENSLVATR